MKINETNAECAVELSKKDLGDLYHFFSNNLLVPKTLHSDPWRGAEAFNTLCRAMDLILDVPVDKDE